MNVSMSWQLEAAMTANELLSPLPELKRLRIQYQMSQAYCFTASETTQCGNLKQMRHTWRPSDEVQVGQNVKMVDMAYEV